MQLHRDRQQFEDAGVSLVVIGQGTPDQAEAFMKKFDVEDLDVLADRRRESYRAAGTKVATVDELFGPSVVAKGIARGLRGGVRQGRTIGHPAQLGGVLVVDTDGRIVWSHLSDDASDTPPNSEVLEAAREAAEAG